MQTLANLAQLHPLQRIILMHNGTLTKLLESLLGEQLTVLKLHESVESSQNEMTYLELPANQNIVQRKICLQGKNSGVNWLYAESVIALDRLPPLFCEELLNSQMPIGKLWIKHRVEIFKELLPPFEETAEDLAILFDIKTSQRLLGRTYRVFSQQQPIMMLTEKFPVHYFTQSF
jgi:chorismate-pyruvate lyase